MTNYATIILNFVIDALGIIIYKYPFQTQIYVAASLAIIIFVFLTFRSSGHSLALLIGMSIFFLILSTASMRSINDVTDQKVSDNIHIDNKNWVTIALSFVNNYLWYVARIIVYSVIGLIVIEIMHFLFELHDRKTFLNIFLDYGFKVVNRPFVYSTIPLIFFEVIFLFFEYLASLGSFLNDRVRERIFVPNLLYVFNIFSNKDVQVMHASAFAIGCIVSIAYGIFATVKILQRQNEQKIQQKKGKQLTVQETEQMEQTNNDAIIDYFSKGVLVNSIAVTIVYLMAFYLIRQSIQSRSR